MVKDQYEGSRAGAKPNGAVILSDRSGNDTVNWNINGWHIENFSVDQVMSQLGDQEPEALKPEKAVGGHHDTALSITRKISEQNSALKAGAWSDRPKEINTLRSQLRRVAGNTVGIFGLGSIGKGFATRVRGFGPEKIIAYDP